MEKWIALILKYLPDAITLAPKVASLVESIAAFRAQYPQLTDEQVAEIVAVINAETLTAIASAKATREAWEAAHPAPPPV